jgi:type IV pilus assembly protein PilW
MKPTEKNACGPHNEQGFTFLELLIYMALLIVALTATYSIFITNTKSYSSQENKVEMTQDLRGAMELMVTEIRMACYDPTGAGDIGFLDNADDTYDTDANSIHFMMDSDGSGAIANAENINYYRKTSGGVQQLIRRDGSGGEPVLGENITGVAFSYRFADGGTGAPDETDGDLTNDLDDVRAVQITITGETAKTDPITRAKKTRSQTSWVVVRNAGLE